MIENLISQIQQIIAQHGALGVFIATLLEEIIAPIPSPLVPLAAGFLLLPAEQTFFGIIWQGLFVIALPVAIGITLGSLLVYSLGYLGGKPSIEKSKKWVGLSWKDIERVESRLIQGKGDEIALFMLRALPIMPGVAISGFCGIVRYPIKTFIAITFFGAFVRAFGLGIIGWHVGEIYAIYSEAISAAGKNILIALIIVIVLFLAWRHFSKKSKDTP
ncbi:MAG: hypothetical protein DDT40_01833 [candidate division WS2 bacterium]|nr:hypothetical protein [Candidatus Psychracetigena formicireducens]